MSEPEDQDARPTNVTETLVAPGAIMPGALRAPGTARTGSSATARTGWSADCAVTELYSLHYKALVRLATLLVSDQATAEDIVQDSFAAVHSSWRTLPDTDAALCYLRRSVVRASRSAPRLPPAGGTPAPGRAGGGQDEGLSPVVSALRALPAPEREVLVLRYFAELPEAEIASATGMSTAAVRSHAARAMSLLRAELHPQLND